MYLLGAVFVSFFTIKFFNVLICFVSYRYVEFGGIMIVSNQIHTIDSTAAILNHYNSVGVRGNPSIQGQ